MLLIFTLFVAANLNAMQSLKRVLPVLLKNGVRLTPRQVSNIKRYVHTNNIKVVRSLGSSEELSERALEYTPRPLILDGYNSRAVEMKRDRMVAQALKERKQRLMLDKIAALLEDKDFKVFLESEDFDNLLKEKFQVFEPEKFEYLVNQQMEVLLKNKELLQKLLKSEAFLKLMNSPDVKQILGIKSNSNLTKEYYGCVFVSAFVISVIIIYLTDGIDFFPV